MLQTILTITAISIALFFALRRSIHFFKNPSTGCDGCHQSCNGCALDDLKKEIADKNALKNS